MTTQSNIVATITCAAALTTASPAAAQPVDYIGAMVENSQEEFLAPTLTDWGRTTQEDNGLYATTILTTRFYFREVKYLEARQQDRLTTIAVFTEEPVMDRVHEHTGLCVWTQTADVRRFREKAWNRYRKTEVWHHNTSMAAYEESMSFVTEKAASGSTLQLLGAALDGEAEDDVVASTDIPFIVPLDEIPDGSTIWPTTMSGASEDDTHLDVPLGWGRDAELSPDPNYEGDNILWGADGVEEGQFGYWCSDGGIDIDPSVFNHVPKVAENTVNIPLAPVVALAAGASATLAITESDRWWKDNTSWVPDQYQFGGPEQMQEDGTCTDPWMFDEHGDLRPPSVYDVAEAEGPAEERHLVVWVGPCDELPTHYEGTWVLSQTLAGEDMGEMVSTTRVPPTPIEPLGPLSK